MRYPDAPRADVVDELHGRRVPDPYRWLEDADTAATRDWSAAQDALARAWLDRLPGRDGLRRRLRARTPGSVDLPHVVGGRAFFARRHPEQEHPVLLVREAGEERVLVDVNAMSSDFTTTLDDWSPSHEGDLLAYQVSEGGTEAKRLRVLDVGTGALVDGPLDVGRHCPVAWLPGGDRFVYVRPCGGQVEFDRRVWLHRVGTDVATDELLFGEGRDRTAYYGVSVSPDGRWLVVDVALGTAPRTDVYVADLTAPALRFEVVQQGVDALTYGRVHRDGRLYLVTDLDAPRRRLVVADPSRPGPDGWRDLLPEQEAVLEDVAITDEYVVAVRVRDVVCEVAVHDKDDGTLVTPITLPGLGVAAVAAPADGGDEVWLSYGDHVTPRRILHVELPDGEPDVWAEPPGAEPVSGVAVRQVRYRSPDGTEIPMFVLAPDDARPGPRPTVLYGYGGFDVSLLPEYSAAAAVWVEAGGVFAVANLRGGGEYGEAWHRAGMRGAKQRVFDDFLAAAQWLVEEGITTPDRLAAQGGSNGGLLVGAALTQRPDLFAAVHCSAPLLDMVRYERFGLGVTWNDEYGTADDPEELGWLLSYSPYHHVVEGSPYPAVLFTVFEGDTRVDPLHARKLCAALQHATSRPAAEAPILLRRERDVGHSTRSVSRTVELSVDVLAFLADRLGLPLD